MRDSKTGRRVPVRIAHECLLGCPRPADRLYMDNASTSFPKPRCVLDAMIDFAVNVGTSAGRGAYAESRAAGEILERCRSRLAELIGAEGPERIAFTMNCSEALSVAIHGILNFAAPGAQVVTTAMEHNSVLRPLEALRQTAGVQRIVIPCDSTTGLVDPDQVRKTLTRRTRLIICTFASNVTGGLQPAREVCRIARENGVPCLIDGAQAVGHVPVDVRALGCDFLAFPGHKGLLGPLGTGGLYVRPGTEKLLQTIKEGGTGSSSERTAQPEEMPQKLEVGSHNLIGLAGLSEAIDWLLRRSVRAIRKHDWRLCRVFASLTSGIPHLTPYGTGDPEQRVGVFSVNIGGMCPTRLAAALEAEAGILTRPGLHCAPLAHQAIGTFPAGTCRLSFGPFTREDDVRRAAVALSVIAEGKRGSTRGASELGELRLERGT